MVGSGLDVMEAFGMKEKTVKDGWSMLMKFGSEENLKKLQAGQLYMKNLKYYVDLEKTISAVRCSVPLGSNWKKRIDEDFKKRGNRE